MSIRCSAGSFDPVGPCEEQPGQANWASAVQVIGSVCRADKV